MFASDSERDGTIVAGRISFVKSCVVDYLLLVKPWIIGLVLVSTLAGIFIAEGGLPPFGLVAGTLLGIGLATAAAASLNNYIDHDIDARMARTSKRPTASGAIGPQKALFCGLGLTIASLAIMTVASTDTAAFLTAVSIFFYVIPYTLILKRRTPLATFVGGIGGALPPVIGYAAAVPALDEKALALFMVIYTWQHPHFWALALKYRNQYAEAGVNNLPVARGVDETKRQIAVWSILLLSVSFIPWIIGLAGDLYLAVAIVTGMTFVAMSTWFLFSPRKEAMSLFFFSIVHLPALYCLMVVDLL